MALGNYLKKKRRNFYLTSEACEKMLQLACHLGVSEAGILELALRAMYDRQFPKEAQK